MHYPMSYTKYEYKRVNKKQSFKYEVAYWVVISMMHWTSVTVWSSVTRWSSVTVWSSVTDY